MSLLWKIVLVVCIFLVAGCNVDTTPTPIFVQANADKTNVIVRLAGSEQPLSPPASARLQVGDGIQVDENGRALLRFSDFLTVEVLRTGDLQVQELDLAEQSALAVFGQSGGAFVNDLAPGASGIQRRVTVETDFAVITATGTRFMVVKEANSPLEWVFGLDASADDLSVQARNDPSAPVVKEVTSGQARWIAPVGEPSAGVNYDTTAVNNWLAAVERGDPVPEVGEVLWPHADARLDTGILTATVRPGMAMDMADVLVTVEEESAFGRAVYAPLDCNNDGIDDIFVQNGIIRLDFRTLLSRVRGLDVTLMAGTEIASGSVAVFDPAVALINRVAFEIEPGQGQIVSLRSEEPYHYAEIAIASGCFLGFSLTPPGPVNDRSNPLPAVEEWPPLPPAAQPTATPTVPYIPPTQTATPTVTPTAMPEAAAIPVPPVDWITIDGNPDDWQIAMEQTTARWIRFDTIVFDPQCNRRFPYAPQDMVDLRAQVGFAYDDTYLYTAFVVEDDGFVGYTGPNLNFFQSDAPQLLLDLDLDGDAAVITNNSDDKQIDFRIGIEEPGDNPAVAFWDLGPGTPRSRLLDAPVAAVATENGYFLEAAIPWDVLGVKPAEGLRLGVAASVSDNDTPGTNSQECMISTSPERDWRNPTTWGVIALETYD